MLLILAVKTPGYFNWDNVKALLVQMAQTGIMAGGTALLMIAGSIDLSIGSLLSVTAVAAALMAAPLGWPLAMILAIAISTGAAFINGAIVWRVRVSPLIVTLGALTAYAGVANLLSQTGGLLKVPASFADLGKLSPAGLPIAVWFMLSSFLVIHLVLTYTVVGRHIYAIGANRETAYLAGLSVRRILLTLFAINGLLVGVAAVLTASRFGTASAQFGVGLELQVITAVILGGVAFNGGEGTAFGVFLGVLLLTVIGSGLISLGVDPFYTNIVQGGVLVLAVSIDQLVLERRERHRKLVAMAEAHAEMQRT
jgi:ribose transport system permease protein